MKNKCLRMYSLSIMTVGLVLGSGCVTIYEGTPSRVVYTPPPPVVEEPVIIPESYVWDGVEYVGVVGDQYVYLGPGNVWLICEPFRLERFHGWAREHADWRYHMTRNEHFRTDRNGRVHPNHGGPAQEKNNNQPGKNNNKKEDPKSKKDDQKKKNDNNNNN